MTMPDTYELRELEVFASGDNLNGGTHTIADLDAMVSAFDALKGKIDPVLKVGHSDQQTLAQADGFPALGWATKLYRRGKKLLADYAKVPRVVYELIKQGAYQKVSAEIWSNLKDPETGITYPLVFTGAALLGADMPAVTSLSDVSAMYQAEQRMCFQFDAPGASKHVYTLADLSAALSDLGYCAGWYQSQSDHETESSVRELMTRVTALMAKIAKGEEAKCKDEMATAAMYRARIPVLMAQDAERKRKEDETMTPEQEIRFKALETTEKQAKADAAELEKLRAERKQYEAECAKTRAAAIEADAEKFITENSTEKNFRIIPAERDALKRLFVRVSEANGSLRTFAVGGKDVTALDDLKAMVAARKPLTGLFKTLSAHTVESDEAAVIEKFEVEVAAAQEKHKLTFAAAVSKVSRENPGLLAEYREAQKVSA